MDFSKVMMLSRALIGSLAVFLLIGCGSPEETKTVGETASATAGAVNVYSGRHYDSDLEIFDAFTAETGININLIEAGGDALIERLAREKEASPADLFITADAGILWRAENRGVLKSIDDPELEARVRAQFRHPDGKWFGLSSRARIVIFNKEMGLPAGLSTYEDLAKPEYEGMICIRSSTNIYNQSLLASIIAHHGSEAAEDWARGVVANFARKPQGNDTSQIEAVAAGLCRIAVVNSYYVARFVDGEIGQKIGALFPNQAGRGTHVNISGAGVAAFAPNEENALLLLKFLLRDETQQAFALGNNEYPIVESVSSAGPVATLGDFKSDTLPAAALGENQRQAVEIFDRVGWP